MFLEEIRVSGHLRICKYDINGNLKQEVFVNNLVTNLGKSFLAQRAISNSVPFASHIAVGSGTTPASTGNNELQAEIDRLPLNTLTFSDNQIVHNVTLGLGEAVGTLSEAGIFTDSSGGTMIARTTFDPLVKTAEDIFNIEWRIVIG